MNTKKPFYYYDSIEFDMNRPAKVEKDNSIEIPDKIVAIFVTVMIIKVIVLFGLLW